MLEKLKNIDWKKTISAFTGIVTIGVIIFLVGWIIYNYVKIDFVKASKYLNSKFFGSILNLLVAYCTLFFFDSLYPGHTIATLMAITPDSSIEDKRNATYLLCASLMANSWIISYQ